MIKNLRRFAKDLRKGQLIRVTRLRRIITPDGPMRIREKFIQRPRKD